MAPVINRPVNPTMAQLMLAKYGLQALQKENEEAEEGGTSQPPPPSQGQQPKVPGAAPAQKQPDPIGAAAGTAAKWWIANKAYDAVNGKPDAPSATTAPAPSSTPTTTPDLGYSETPRPAMGPTVEAAAVNPQAEPGYFDNFGNYIQGAGGAYQGWAGYNQWKKGDKVGGGLNMAAGGANMAAAAGSSSAASAGPYLSTALGAYNVGKALNGEGSDEERANEGTKAAATALGDFYTFGGASLGKKAFSKEVKEIDKVVDPIVENEAYQWAFNPYLYGAAKLMGGKQEDQVKRDRLRGTMQEGGFLDPNYNVQLANGATFDMGQDGSKRIYNPDPTNPATAETIADTNLLATLIAGPDTKAKNDLGGMLTSAALSQGDPVSNVIQLYQNAGITSGDQAREIINQLQTNGIIAKEEGDQMQQNIAKLFGRPTNKPAARPSSGSKGGGGSEKKPDKKKGKGSSGSRRPALFPAQKQEDRVPGSSATFSMSDYINSINRIRAQT